MNLKPSVNRVRFIRCWNETTAELRAVRLAYFVATAATTIVTATDVINTATARWVAVNQECPAVLAGASRHAAGKCHVRHAVRLLPVRP
jgi:hypothetical protein